VRRAVTYPGTMLRRSLHRSVVAAGVALLVGGCSAGASTSTTSTASTTSTTVANAPLPPQKLYAGTKTWSYEASTTSGLSEKVTVLVGAPRRFAANSMIGPVTIGAACHFGPDDLLFPVELFLKNTSKSAMPLAAAFTVLLGPVPGPGQSEFVLENEVTEPPSCNVPHDIWSIKTAAVAPGKQEPASVVVFAITNYFGPHTPSGDSGALIALQLTPAPAFIAPGAPQFLPGAVSGPGEPATHADSINLDGLRPAS
jgi:hypothetical protein